MAKKRVSFRLYNTGAGGTPGQGEGIRAAGGFVIVTKASNPAKATLFTSSGGSQANGFALTAGGADFYIEDSVDATVDLFIMSPSGHFACKYGVNPGVMEIGIDLQQRRQLMVVPFAAADYTAAAETSTGFVFPRCLIESPNLGMFVHTADAAKSLEVGLLSSETGGDADGLIDALLFTTAGQIPATLTNAALTVGALLRVFSTGGTVDVPKAFGVTGTVGVARTLTFTPLAATAAAKAYVQIPYSLTSDQPANVP